MYTFSSPSSFILYMGGCTDVDTPRESWRERKDAHWFSCNFPSLTCFLNSRRADFAISKIFVHFWGVMSDISSADLLMAGRGKASEEGGIFSSHLSILSTRFTAGVYLRRPSLSCAAIEMYSLCRSLGSVTFKPHSPISR